MKKQRQSYATFRERVKKVHAGTIHEKTYLAACDFAELMLEGGCAKSGERAISNRTDNVITGG